MLAIIGGTGLYELPGMEIEERIGNANPFGTPSGAVVRGRLNGGSGPCSSSRATATGTNCCRTRSTTAPTSSR